MKCNGIQELAADWLNGGLSTGEKEAFSRHLEECAACRKEIEEMKVLWDKMDAALDEDPGTGLEYKFNSLLDAYTHGSRGVPRREHWAGGTVPFPGAWRPVLQTAAAVALVALGVLLGRGMEHVKVKDMEIALLRREMAQMHELVTISLMTQNSAIDRLQGVSMSGEVGNPDERLLNALVKTLDTDSDVSVRLAALDALGRYAGREWIRKALVNSLEMERSPLMQVSLIDLLVQLREPGAKNALKSIIEDKDTMDSVKKRARTGLEKMI